MLHVGQRERIGLLALVLVGNCSGVLATARRWCGDGVSEHRDLPHLGYYERRNTARAASCTAPADRATRECAATPMQSMRIPSPPVVWLRCF